MNMLIVMVVFLLTAVVLVMMGIMKVRLMDLLYLFVVDDNYSMVILVMKHDLNVLLTIKIHYHINVHDDFLYFDEIFLLVYDHVLMLHHYFQ